MLDLDNKLIALIMIGGQSTRMGGGIKSFLKFNNQSLFDRVLNLTTPQIKKIIINCNDNNEKLLKYKIPIIEDIKKGYLGPLAGIHSAMSWVIKNDPEIEWLITLPGDTPFIPKDLIFSFKQKISSNSKIILAKSDNKIHPIIGAWHISLFKSLDTELDKGVRKIMYWANKHIIDYINYQINTYDPFFNINRKEDIAFAKEIEKKFLKNN